MENAVDISQGLNHISLPIKIKYTVVEQLLRQKMIGEDITSEDRDGKKSTYAKILDLSLEKSRIDDFDIAINLKFKALTTLFKNKEGEIVVNALLDFDKDEQQLYVTDFKLDGTTKNWLFNNSLEMMANNFMHEKLKNKMKFDFGPEIEKQLVSINGKLDNELEIAKGIFLSGHLNTFTISRIISEKNQFSILVDFKGSTVLDVRQIDIKV